MVSGVPVISTAWRARWSSGSSVCVRAASTLFSLCASSAMINCHGAPAAVARRCAFERAPPTILPDSVSYETITHLASARSRSAPFLITCTSSFRSCGSHRRISAAHCSIRIGGATTSAGRS